MTPARWIRRRCTVPAIPHELVVAIDGRAVAVLTDPLLDDMFWFKWRITPLVADAPVTSEAFWTDDALTKTTFRCRASGAVTSAFWPASDPIRDGRLVLRGAYVPAEVHFKRNPLLWLRLFLPGRGVREKRTGDA